MYYQKTMDFSEWVVAELDERGWSRSEAARRGGISPSMFDKVINGQAKPGLKFIEGIARAFKMSSAEVMMHVSNRTTNDPWVEEMSHKLTLIPSGLRTVAGKFIDSMVQGEEAEEKPRSKAKPAKV